MVSMGLAFWEEAGLGAGDPKKGRVVVMDHAVPPPHSSGPLTMKRPRGRKLLFLAVILAVATAVVVQLRWVAKMQTELAAYDSARNLWRMKVLESNPR